MWTRLYAWTMGLAGHRHATRWLGALSFAESSFFPIPPDILLAPMVLAHPQKAWVYAALTTLTSVLGGVLGFFIGVWLLDAAMPLITEWGYEPAFDRARLWFEEWGFWAVFLAGFTPIPYKVFTIAAGANGMFLPLFVLASLIGRGGRFFLVALLVSWAGPKVEPHLHRYMDRIGWSLLAAVIVGLLIYRYV